MSALSWRDRRGVTGGRVGIIAASIVLLLLATILTPTGARAQDEVPESPFGPVDPQNWVDQADLTWDAYVPIRPEAWNQDTTSTATQNQYRTAIVLVDYPDQPILITQEPESHPFGNPQPGWEPVAREDVNQWYEDYYSVPNEYNGGQTLHGYWMETTHGRIGVTVDVYGPYTMPGKSFEYGIPDGSFNAPANTYCPQGHSCNRNIRNDGNVPFRAEVNATGGNCPGTAHSLCGYDNLFYVTAGHDESSTWQAFGEMLFSVREDVPASLGPPGATEGPVLNNSGQVMTNWATTRYVPWTSWRAAANHWPNASGGSSTQAESSGQSVFAHEFSHLRGLPDNYNNPFADNQRNFTGYWEMMSRGTFNGPGGTHNRWQVPNAGGSGLGPHHTLHFKNSLNAFGPGEQLTLGRDALLGQGGTAVIPLKAREYIPDGDLVGLTVNWTTNLTPSCAVQGIPAFYCLANNWTAYRIEVVDRVGNDSFVPGHGVLINQSRASGTPQVFMVDPNPEDINMVDFYRPDGTPVMVVRGDPRQLNDATFHAGTDSGSEYEMYDQYNGLQFYVLDKYENDKGELMYDIGVRRTTGTGSFVRGVELGDSTRVGVDPFNTQYDVDLTTTGAAGTGYFDSDIYRITSSIEGEGWSTWQPHDVVAAAAGETVPVSVTATREEGAAETATLTVTATSETDPTKSHTTVIEVLSPAAAADALADAVAEVDPTDAQWKLVRFVDRIEREIANENWSAACAATATYLAEIDRLAGLRPERNPLPPDAAEALRGAATEVHAALGCGG